MRLADLLFGDAAARRVVPASGFTTTLATLSAAAMAFLAVFAIALSLAAGKLAARWSAELEGTATIRISAPADEIDAQTDAVLNALSQTPGIAGARIVGADEQRSLLTPWFGSELPIERLNLPVLIEINETRQGPDQEGLRQRLKAEAPGAVYDSHGRWRAPLIEAAGWMRQLALLSLLLIGAVMAVILALAASVALAANAQIIAVLRLVGATDAFVIRAFVSRFTLRAVLGALAGALIGAIALAFVPDGPEAGILAGLGFDGAEWLWPLALPLLTGGISFAATHLAARRRLREIN